MTLPAVRLIRQNDTHRLIPSRYGEGDDSVLVQIADDDAHLQDLFDLDHATNDRLLAENDRVLGIGIHELVFGVPAFRIVNAAFCHPHPLGSRFSGPERGAWYAAFELETAQAEIAFHKWTELAEVGWTEEELTYDDYLADFSAELHDVRRDKRFSSALAPDSYVASQELAEKLLEAGSLGIVYPSVRRPRGTCVACFRPALVMNVRRGRTYRFRWEGEPKPSVSVVR
ncbi:MAG TPA: RES family NAD+ phosphorylase [Thermoanaerobaculia bacterium]|nr:RES family NAD+ phosphorylase [Thermoanaerobaculia bacterium]